MDPADMPEDVNVDILIVGAGFAGAATAHHLAQSSDERLLIVEQEEVPGMHSSGRNAAIVREHADQSSLQAMITEGATRLRQWGMGFEQCGLMVLGAGHEDAAQYFPRARGRGRWCEKDGVVDIAGLLQYFLWGQNVQYNTRVLGWIREGSGLRVYTTRGEIVTRLLVNAAGPWAGNLGELPLTPTNRHLFVSTPLEWVDPEWPVIWDGRHGLYFRPESGGLLFSCCDEHHGRPGCYDENPAMLEELASKVSTLQPDLGELCISKVWVGQRVFARDRRFVIGFDPRDHRVFHVAGLGGHGVTASFAVGRLAAQLIITKVVYGAEAFAPSRLLSPRTFADHTEPASYFFSAAHR